MEQTDQYSLCAGFRPHFARDARAHFARDIKSIRALYFYQVRLKQLLFESILIDWLHSEGHIEEDRKKIKAVQGHGKIIKFLFT